MPPVVQQLINREYLSSLFSEALDADSTDKSLMEVRSFQIVNFNNFVAVRSMDKFVVADVNSHVPDRFPCAEKDEISLQKFVFINT